MSTDRPADDAASIYAAGATKHTAEPWAAKTENGTEILGTDGLIVAIILGPHRSDKEDAANAARIVACVNACAGMEDPAKALRKAREALALAISYTEKGRSTVRGIYQEALRALGG